MSETFIDNMAIVIVLFTVAWLIGRYSPAEKYITRAAGPDEAEDWSECYPPRTPSSPLVAFKSLKVGQQFRIPYILDSDLTFEKIRPTEDGDNARCDIYSRFVSPLMHVEIIPAPIWRTS